MKSTVDKKKPPQVPNWVIGEWYAQVEGRDEAKPQTNGEMYAEIRDMHRNGEELDYDTIAEIFNLESRDWLDLQNLRDFIIAITLMGGQDILKTNNVLNKQIQVQTHEKRVELMNLLNDAIESVI